MLVPYVILVVTGGFTALWASGFGEPAPASLPFLFWILANVLSEILWLPAPRGRGYLSMATVANFAAIVVLPTPLAVAVTSLAQALTDLLFRRRRWYQILFNFGMCCITVFLASKIFTGLGGVRDSSERLLSPLNALPLAATAVVYFLVNTGLVAGVIALEKRQAVWRVWRTGFGFPFQVLGSATLSLLGFFFAVLFLAWGYISAFLAVAATLFVRDAYMRYVRELDRRSATASAP